MRQQLLRLQPRLVPDGVETISLPEINDSSCLARTLAGLVLAFAIIDSCCRRAV